MSTETIHGAPGWSLASDLVRLHVTTTGGMMAPVVFNLDGREVSPYTLSPWLPDEFPDQPPLLTHLRGDFLCLPFGPQSDGPPHGTPANHDWQHVSSNKNLLHLALDATDSRARVEKLLTLRDGHTAVYCEHRITGLAGDWSYGNHPILDLSALPEGAARVSISPFRWGSVYPGLFSDPARGETQALAESAPFTDLTAVPMAAGGTTDLTRWPARPGCDDLVMMVNDPATPEQPFAWSAVAADGWIWFSLKNPADFPSTLFWMSNGGRSAAPWNSRHLGRLGIEEVCSHFCDSVDASRASHLPTQGIPTTRHFRAEETVALRVIQTVAPVPENFGKVARICPSGPNSVAITSDCGKEIMVPIDWEFVL